MSKEKQNELLINDGESNSSEVISNKQIDEMAKVICKTYAEKRDCETCPTEWCYAEEYATLLYCAGYRKQSEGEWIDKPTGAYSRMQSWCSACGKHSGIGGIESNRHKPYCPNCGAKMKGAENEK